jgi:hypothetical protein
MRLKIKLPKKATSKKVLAVGLPLAFLSILYTYKLGTLTGGISKTEAAVSNMTLGWTGLYEQPMFAALNFLRSVIFYLQPDFGNDLLRLSNVIIGILGCLAFYAVVRSWHGTKIAILAGLLFACSAASLHVARLASNDVMYLVALPLLFYGYTLPRKYPGSKLPLFFNTIVWLILLYTPGLVWLVLISVHNQKLSLAAGIKALPIYWKALYGVFVALPIGLLGYLLYLNNGFKYWIGLPAQFAEPLLVLKDLVAVPVHLFVRGPEYPELWLGNAPILDIFCAAMCVIGIYFYAKNAKATRSKTMLLYGITGTILIGISGPVSIVLLMPLLYLLVATGITYMRQEWLHVFPLNPIARVLGTGLIVIAVALSCFYNMRSYFVAWPHNDATQTAFSRQIER